MNASAKKWILNLLKLGVCAVALWYLSTKVTWEDHVRIPGESDPRHRVISTTDHSLTYADADTGAEHEVAFDPGFPVPKDDTTHPQVVPGLKTVVTRTNWSWVAWAVAIMGPVTFVIAWRLRLLLATQDIQLSMRDALLLTFAGNFFNFAMPGSTGGDLYKAYHIAKRTTKRVQGVTIVFLDRVVGLVSFLLIAAVILLFAGRTGRIGVFGQIVGYLTAGLVVSGMLFFSRRVRGWIRYDALLSKLPFADKLRRIDETTFSFRFHKGQAITALLATFFSHVCLVTYIYCLARAFGIHATGDRTELELYFAVMMSTVVGFLLAAVPISFQGFGLMELVFVRVMVEGDWCDYSTMLALTIALRFVQVFWSLPGVIVPWLGLERPPETVSEESIEHMGEEPMAPAS